VAYGLVIVTVVVGVVNSDSDGIVTSPAVSVGESGGPVVGFRSVVETRVGLVVVVFVVVREVVVGVVRLAGANVSGLCFCELSAVCITAYTNITSSSIAATPET
jgi:hypothetical protein